MKVSDAILYCIQQEGGQVSATQFDEWIGKLTGAGYLEFNYETFQYALTDRAIQRLKREGL